MPVIKVQVIRKADGELVYGNQGDKDQFESKFDQDMAKYSAAEYDIIKEDVSAELDKEKARRDGYQKALDNLKKVDLSKSVPASAVKDMVRVLIGR